MSANSSNLKLFLSAEKIQAAVADLATRIEADYAKLTESGGDLIIVVTLKGALFFAADLMRKIERPVLIDFVRVSSYGSGTKSSGNVVMTKDVENPVRGNHILILDEIVDSGHTIKFLLEKFSQSEAASVKVCSLLNKPSRREAQVHVDYVGLDVEDKFLVGYGLDFNEKYRNLKAIYTLEG
ncbi:MAG: hypoxanthine phosphoribosyltransferase [Bdellovibrionaceae bacterium]|nr:hypoxanthine phosphoribosyltransferase [Pseudobdellovibrionaceae bacterium]